MTDSILQRIRRIRKERKREELKNEFIGRLRRGKRYSVRRTTKPPLR